MRSILEVRKHVTDALSFGVKLCQSTELTDGMVDRFMLRVMFTLTFTSLCCYCKEQYLPVLSRCPGLPRDGTYSLPSIVLVEGLSILKEEDDDEVTRSPLFCGCSDPEAQENCS